ncbi:MAG: hypothetical protein HC927_13250 [Deltaproteobacteria bacterium]|nr:hypothetical protein [Deltaproteobacteria bacterium]
MISGDDPTPWNLLHDGKLVRITRTPTGASLTIELPHLRARFEPPGECFVVHVHELALLAYLPYSDRWDEPLIEDAAEIVARLPPQILGDFYLGNTLGGLLAWYGNPILPLRSVLDAVTELFWNGARASRSAAA